MNALLSGRIVAAALAGALAFSGPALSPAFAQTHHYNGGHGGAPRHNGNWRGHYAGGGYYRHGYYGYGGPYYGGPYYGGGYYGAPCLPVLGLVSGNFCGY